MSKPDSYRNNLLRAPTNKAHREPKEEPPLIIDDKFAYWAFGGHWDGYKTLELDIIDMMAAWDKIHEEMPFDQSKGIFENLMMMRKAYENFKKEMK